MIFRKLLVDMWFKTYSIINVSKDCFDISLNIEEVGSMTGFKIYSEDNLNFRITELKRVGFSSETNES